MLMVNLSLEFMNLFNILLYHLSEYRRISPAVFLKPIAL